MNFFLFNFDYTEMGI